MAHAKRTTWRPLLGLAGGMALLHFAATWFLLLLSWNHDWADAMENVLSFPGRLAAGYVGGDHEKLQNTALMLANSVVWSSVLVTVLELTRWRIRRKR